MLISDFISEPGWERSLELLQRRHEVVAVRLIDPREIELPDVGLIVVEDAETGEQLFVDTGDAEFRRRFEEAAGAREAAISAAFRRAGVEAAVAVDRRRPRPGDRPDGDAPPPAADGLTVTFVWPQLLAALLLLPLGILAYRAVETRRRRRRWPASAWGWRRVRPAACFGVRAPIDAAPGKLPGILFVLGLAVLLVALARPQASVSLPQRRAP